MPSPTSTLPSSPVDKPSRRQEAIYEMVSLPAADGKLVTMAPVWAFAEDKDAAILLAQVPKGAMAVNQAMLVEALTLEKNLQQCAVEHEVARELQVIKQESGKARRAKVQQYRVSKAAQNAALAQRQVEIDAGKTDLSTIVHFSGLKRLESKIAPQLPQLPDHTRRKFLKLIAATAVTMSALWRQAAAVGGGGDDVSTSMVSGTSGSWSNSSFGSKSQGLYTSDGPITDGVSPGTPTYFLPNSFMQCQQHSEWCWAAVAASIAHKYSSTTKQYFQCNLVNAESAGVSAYYASHGSTLPWSGAEKALKAAGVNACFGYFLPFGNKFGIGDKLVTNFPAPAEEGLKLAGITFTPRPRQQGYWAGSIWHPVRPTFENIMKLLYGPSWETAPMVSNGYLVITISWWRTPPSGPNKPKDGAHVIVLNGGSGTAGDPSTQYVHVEDPALGPSWLQWDGGSPATSFPGNYSGLPNAHWEYWMETNPSSPTP